MGIPPQLQYLFNKVNHSSLIQLRQWLEVVDVRELISHCAEDTYALAAIAPRSYVHANGHERIELPRPRGARIGIMVHVWHKYDLPQGDAHNHKWTFASRVLAGCLRNHIYRAESRSEGSHTSFRHVKTPTGYRLAQTGYAELYEEALYVIPEGSSYQMDPQPVHKVSAGTDYLATISVEMAPAREFTNVYRRRGDVTGGGRVVPVRFDTPRVQQILRDLAARVR